MSSNIAEIAVEATLILNPLDFISGEIPFDVPYGPPGITGASPGGYSGRCSRGQEAELENERSGSRFRWQLSRLPTNGRCDARLNSDCGTQGASSRHISTPDEGLREWCSAYASQLSARF